MFSSQQMVKMNVGFQGFLEKHSWISDGEICMGDDESPLVWNRVS